MAATGFDPGTPGFTLQRISSESAVLFQSFFLGDVVYDGFQVIDSTAVDSGNSPTNILRPGLVMAKLYSNGAWVAYDATSAVAGVNEARGVLVQEVNLLDYSSGASATRLWGVIVIAGKAKASALLGLNQQARQQLNRRGFLFDDDAWFSTQTFRQKKMNSLVGTAGTYQVLAADHGKLIVSDYANTNAFNLPTIAAAGVGYTVEFLNIVNQTMTVASPDGAVIICDGNAAVTTITANLASHKIGVWLRLELVDFAVTTGTSVLRWVCTSKNANTTAMLSFA